MHDDGRNHIAGDLKKKKKNKEREEIQRGKRWLLILTKNIVKTEPS